MRFPQVPRPSAFGDSDWERLARYLADECTPAERVAVEEWLAADPTRQARVDALRRVWARAAGSTIDGMIAPAFLPPAAWDVAALSQRLNERLDQLDQIEGKGRPVQHGRDGMVVIPRAHRVDWAVRALTTALAAALVLAIGVTVVRRSRGGASYRLIAAREYVTARGQRETIRLPDRTRLTLGPESRLRVADDFGRASRDVELNGEAMFDVVHDAARPFAVRVGRVVTRDLGTRFGVRAYPGDAGVRVVVAAGSVSLAGATLHGGDLAVVSAGDTAQVRHGVDAERELAWANGTVAFDNTPLADVLSELGRWYDIDFRLADTTVGTRRVSVSFRTESPTQVLDAVGLLIRARYERHGQFVTFYPTNRLTPQPAAGSMR